jgi:hypothetical protein
MHIFLSSLALQPNKMFRDDFSVIFLRDFFFLSEKFWWNLFINLNFFQEEYLIKITLHKTSSTQPLFIEIPVLRQESEQSCIHVFWGYWFFLCFCDFFIGIWNYSDCGSFCICLFIACFFSGNCVLFVLPQ